jgi:hypothetical protein
VQWCLEFVEAAAGTKNVCRKEVQEVEWKLAA